MNDDYLNGYQKVSSVGTERRQYIGLEKQECGLLGIYLIIMYICRRTQVGRDKTDCRIFTFQ